HAYGQCAHGSRLRHEGELETALERRLRAERVLEDEPALAEEHVRCDCTRDRAERFGCLRAQRSQLGCVTDLAALLSAGGAGDVIVEPSDLVALRGEALGSSERALGFFELAKARVRDREEP